MAKNSNNKNNNNSNKSGSGFPINKFSFYTIGIVCVLYLVATILSFFSLDNLAGILNTLKDCAGALLLVVPGLLAWKYVRNKQTVWKVLYIVFFAILLICFILPMFSLFNIF